MSNDKKTFDWLTFPEGRARFSGERRGWDEIGHGQNWGQSRLFQEDIQKDYTDPCFFFQGKIMPFVNEYIPAEDFEQYHLREIDKHHLVGGVNARQWTVNREQDSYLRRLTRGREDWAHVSEWTFRWSGTDYTLYFIWSMRRDAQGSLAR